MDYVKDGSLRNILKNISYKWHTVLNILKEIISGLDAIYKSNTYIYLIKMNYKEYSYLQYIQN